jgi:hypothetical protein
MATPTIPIPAVALSLSSDVGLVAKAFADVVTAVAGAINVNRNTMSAGAKEEADHIQFQGYWDLRHISQSLGIVPAPMQWPPAELPK